MKQKLYSISEDGDVVATGHKWDSLAVVAESKAEATAKLLKQCNAAARTLPELFVKNGAYLLIRFDGKFWVAETHACFLDVIHFVGRPCCHPLTDLLLGRGRWHLSLLFRRQHSFRGR